MAHTPGQRSRKPLCNARKKDGERCRMFAGQGTDHPGIGKCHLHGGKTTSHNRHAIKVEATRRMAALGVPLEHVNPHEALVGLLRSSAGHVAFLTQAVAEIDDLSSQESLVLTEIYNSERDRLTRIAKACADVGVSERQIRLQEAQAGMFAEVVMAAAAAFGLKMDQRRQFMILVAEELEAREAIEPDELTESRERAGGIFSD